MATLTVLGAAAIAFGVYAVRHPKAAFTALVFLLVSGEILALASAFDG